jgi:preprotein translocase subunit YajC
MHSELAGAGFALHGLLAATTTTTKAKTSTSATGFLILLLIIAGAYMLFIRPKRAQLRAQSQAGPTVEIDDEVITNSGIIGRVVRFEGDRVILEVAPGTNITIYRNALGRRIEPRVNDYYPPPADPSEPVAGGEPDAAPGQPEANGHPEGSDGPWWPGPTGDATPSSGGST